MELNPTTVVFEVINFLVLVWILSRLFYRPLKRAIRKRQKAIDDEQAATRTALDAAVTLEKEWQEKHRRIAEIREQARTEALESAAAERERILRQAQEDARAERSRAQALLEAERSAAEQWLGEVAVERCTGLATELIMKLAPDAIDRASLAGLVQTIDDHGDRFRYDSDGAVTPNVQIRVARPPSEAELTELRSAFERALGVPPALSVVEDDTLIGGFRVEVGHHIIDASVQGKMKGLRELAGRVGAQGA